jgi:hypothetical protein
MTRRQTRTSLAIVGMAVLATMVTTTISHAHPALALGHSNNPDGLTDFLGRSLSDIEELLNKGRSNFPDPNGGGLSQLPSDTGVDNMAPSRTPGDEMGSTNTPEKDDAKGGEGVPTDEESVAEGSDTSNGNGRDSKYENFQSCLADAAGEGSPTEQQVQDCAESIYPNNSESTPSDGTESSEEDENGVTERVSTDDAEDEEEEEDPEE